MHAAFGAVILVAVENIGLRGLGQRGGDLVERRRGEKVAGLDDRYKVAARLMQRAGGVGAIGDNDPFVLEERGKRGLIPPRGKAP